MKKLWKAGLLVLCTLLLAACGSEEKTKTPVITSKPKVKIIEPATPTPTLTAEKGELPETSEIPEATATEAPTPEPTSTPKPKATSTPKPKATATPKPTKKPTATPTPKPEKLVYSKGNLTDQSFESKWMGLRFTAPKGVTLSTQEELDDTMRLVEEAVTGKNIEGNLDYADLSLVYELSAVWQDEGMLMQLLVERVPEAVTLEEYINQGQEEIDMLEASGLTYIMDSEIYKEVIGGKEFSNYGYTTYYEELGMRQENYLRKQDDRIILLSITCDEASAERIPKLLDAFQAY